MTPTDSTQFHYTHYFTASHIVITGDEPAVILPGVYANTLTGTLEDIDLGCSFAQLNEILHCDGTGPDEVTDLVAEMVAEDTATPFTIDVTATGGLDCPCLLYCLKLSDMYNEGNSQQPFTAEYHLEALIKKDFFIDYNRLALPVDKADRISYYVLLLAIRYRFYLYFVQSKATDEAALYFAGLQDPLIFELAKTRYTLLQAEAG